MGIALWRREESPHRRLNSLRGALLWLLFASALATAQLAYATCGVERPAPGEKCKFSDFNNDGKSDIFWRNTASGQNYIYPMNGTTILGTEAPLRTIADQSWQVVGIGDFNGDGHADILWRNSATGQNYIYPMNGTAILGTEGYIRTIADQNWQVAGVGDFDGDGKADILWRNQVTGENYIYPMNGLTIKGTEGYIRTIADPSWQIVGVGDFDGDLKADILLRNTATGQNYIYPMDGLTIKGTEGYLRTVADQNWQVVGVGDFNGDDHADILWRNRATGENYIYPMNGTAILSAEGYLRTVSDQNWQVAAVGDYDGDGKYDILWRNASTGEDYIYPMNGTAILGTEGYTRTTITQWRPVGQLSTRPGSVPGCTTITPTGGPITSSLVATRVSGVAPLYVHFDATGTTAAATSRPFHDLEYRWNFGDPGSGSWTATPVTPNPSRNSATGPLAAHVFESPGTYTVCMSVFDGTNAATAIVNVTVQDPSVVYSGTKTICVSTSGTFTGCPSGSAQVTTSSWATVVSNIATNRRVLLRRGEAWTSSFNVIGPGKTGWTIGAFGSGANPLLQSGAADMAFPLNTVTDARIMDITADGAGTTDSQCIGTNSGFHKQITVMRVTCRNFGEGSTFYLGEGTAINQANYPWEEFVFYESTFTGIYRYDLFLFIQHLAVLGNTLDVVSMASNGHVTRLPYIYKSVISNNNFTGGSGGHHVIKLSGMQTGVYNELILISNNKINGGDSGWAIAIAPQNNIVDERVRNVIVEDNWLISGSITDYILILSCGDTTVRNNLFDLSAGNSKAGVNIFQRGIEPAPIRNAILNNTFYSSAAASTFAAVTIDASATNTTVKNNLAYAPLDASHAMISGTGSGLVASNNSTNAQVLLIPNFVSLTPSVPADFRLNAGSYAIGSGSSIPVFSDFFRLNRPRNGVFDLGAIERP